MKKTLLLLISLFLIVPFGMAQDMLVKGLVTGAGDGLPIPGVSVVKKGTTIGTSTDFEGRYELNVTKGDVLTFSFVGMVTQEVEVGSQNEINVALKSESIGMEEVVVTALGIKREKKALGYAVQDVKGEELVKVKETNLVNALNGKIAGVNVTNSSGAPGTSSQIIIRGGASLTLDNQPLFVIDGIPIDNSTSTGAVGGSAFDGMQATTSSFSNRAMDLNPADIESISVLKGPAAAALYGLKAASGAIVITTKQGQKGKTTVSFSSRFSIDQVNQLPAQQSKYSQGTGDTTNIEVRSSWGDEFVAGEPIYNNMENFFEDAKSWEHNLNISGGSEKGTFFMSAARVDQKGIVPETDYIKNTFRLNASHKVNDYITVGANTSYISSSSVKTLTGSGLWGSQGGYMSSIIQWPRNDDMRRYLNFDGSKRRLLPNFEYFDDVDNPYWTVKNNPVTSRVNRFVGNIFTEVKPASWLTINYKLGIDRYNRYYKSVRAFGTSLKDWYNGGVSETSKEFEMLNSLLVANIHKEINPDLNVDLTLGHSMETLKTLANSFKGYGFQLPTFVSINNTDIEQLVGRPYNQSTTKKRLIGVFGDFKLAYKNMLFAEVTGRNDWTSTLPIGSHSFFYPSASLGFVFSELMPKNDILSFGKFRASWAQVGKDAPLYTTFTNVEPATSLGGGYRNSWGGANPDLVPEMTTSTEFGVDLRFLQGRFGIDATYYTSKSEDLITTFRGSNATGYIFKTVNAGDIENKGFELSITATPLKTKDFSWDILANITKNKGKVTKLPGDIRILYVTEGQTDAGKAASFLDGAFLGISGLKWQTDSLGRLLIGDDGYPVTSTSDTNRIGNREPDLILGITNNFSYKNWSLSFLFDIRMGGDVFNATETAMVGSGLSAKTTNRGEKHIFDGVVEQEDGTFVPNTTEVVLDQNYYQNIYTKHGPHFVEDASWVRLRSLSLTYSLSEKILKKTPFTKLDFTFTGRNLLLITDYSGMDPEVSAGGAGVTGAGNSGIDYMGVPATRGFSFGIKANF